MSDVDRLERAICGVSSLIRDALAEKAPAPLVTFARAVDVARSTLRVQDP